MFAVSSQSETTKTSDPERHFFSSFFFPSCGCCKLIAMLSDACKLFVELHYPYLGEKMSAAVRQCEREGYRGKRQRLVLDLTSLLQGSQQWAIFFFFYNSRPKIPLDNSALFDWSSRCVPLVYEAKKLIQDIWCRIQPGDRQIIGMADNIDFFFLFLIISIGHFFNNNQ